MDNGMRRYHSRVLVQKSITKVWFSDPNPNLLRVQIRRIQNLFLICNENIVKLYS